MPCSCTSGATRSRGDTSPAGVRSPDVPDQDIAAQAARWRTRFTDLMTARGGPVAHAEHDSMSHQELREAIEQALHDRGDDAFVEDVFPDDSVVFTRFEEDGPPMTFRESFTVDANGSVSLAGDAVEVRPKIEFVPVEGAGEETDTDDGTGNGDAEMDANELIANEANTLTEQDKPWLQKLDANELKALAEDERFQKPKEPDAASDTTTSTNAEPAKESEKAEAEPEAGNGAETESTQANTPEDFIANAPAEIQAVLNDGLQSYRQKHNALVEELKANSRCEFQENELKGMSVEQLERIAKLARHEASGQPERVNPDANTPSTHNVELAKPPSLKERRKAKASA